MYLKHELPCCVFDCLKIVKIDPIQNSNIDREAYVECDHGHGGETEHDETYSEKNQATGDVKVHCHDFSGNSEIVMADAVKVECLHEHDEITESVKEELPCTYDGGLVNTDPTENNNIDTAEYVECAEYIDANDGGAVSEVKVECKEVDIKIEPAEELFEDVCAVQPCRYIKEENDNEGVVKLEINH